jgi:hypothetical protein
MRNIATFMITMTSSRPIDKLAQSKHTAQTPFPAHILEKRFNRQGTTNG